MRRLCALILLLIAAIPFSSAQRTRKIVLIAGIKSHGPGAHEYLKSVKLLKVLLDRAPNLGGVSTEIHYNGWPEDAKTLDTADTIVAITDGQPSDTQLPMPLMTDEHMPVLRRQMARGCGIMLIHYSTFPTYRFASDILDWAGGYYEWKGPKEKMSAIKTLDTSLTLPSPEHPTVRGIAPFQFRDEYYYRLRLHGSAVPIVRVPVLSDVPSEQTVAWAIQREDGGRGFGTSTGHFFENWKNDNYRKLILNAIAWTARTEVPKGGVESKYADEDEVNRELIVKPVAALIVNNDNSGSLWAAQKN